MTTEQNNDMLDSMVANDALQTDNCNDMGTNAAMRTCVHAGECGNSGNCGSACSGGCDNCGCGFCQWGDGNLRGLSAKGCGRSDHQLNSYDYLADVPGNVETTDFVEVQFKNTRKGFYRNDNHLDLQKGDTVAVEAQPGHDIGVVSLTGKLVLLQMQKANLKPGFEIKRIYRKARPTDIEKYEEAKAREHETMIRSRQIAKDLELQMKIGDVEYQGDGNKAIFYYIADARVDFRKLIKVLAEAFRVRIEMKQIGARQEAGRIGGIGPCGRELCCATWMKNFSSVSTAAARFQDITPNPQKLAGQCAKLKCCLNYEVDTYMEAARKLPERNATLDTIDGTYYFFKADTLAGLVTYSSDRRMGANLVTITAERAKEVLAMNANGEKPDTLLVEEMVAPKGPVDLAEQDDLTRFDKSKRNKNRRERRNNKGEARAAQRGEGRRNEGENRQNDADNSQKGDNNGANQTQRRDRRDNNRRRDRRDRREGGNNRDNGGNRENSERRDRNNNREGGRNERRNGNAPVNE